jgi:hypothetical protein
MSRRRDTAVSVAVLILGLLGQIAFGQEAREVRVRPAALDAPPAPLLREALALGDRQMLFRAIGLSLLHAGDTGGRTTPLARYDYRQVVSWLETLDALDAQSTMAPALAAFYFAQTPVAADAERMVRYLMEATMLAPERRWRYLAHAVFIAKHRVGQPALALEAARRLAALRATGIPVWARQMPAFILADMGEPEQAAALFAALLAEADDLPPEEVRYMTRMLEIYRRRAADDGTPP